MYDDLVKRLRNCTSDTVEDCTGCPYQGGYKGTYCMNGLIDEAADAIEELAAFKAQITDGHFYCMRDGILYKAKLNPPKGKSIKLPPIKYAEPPKEAE